MNLAQKMARKVIKKSFDLSVSSIEYFSNMKPYHRKVAELRQMEKGSLGKEIADCLDQYDLSLVPKFESHDLKHVLLDYKMTPEDEIRMQAFMIGNGNYSIPSFAIFVFGAALLPDLWSVFYSDFKKGQGTQKISKWNIDQYANHSLTNLRQKIKRNILREKQESNMKRITQFGAFTCILAGALGMLYCLPYLFSSHLEDLVGAGFPFIAGAILTVGGLFSLSNMARPHRETSVI